MNLSRFGQIPGDSEVISYVEPTNTGPTQSIGAPSPIKSVANSYIIPAQSNFAKFMLSRPGQPYVLNLKSEDVEKALYKNLPTAPPEKIELLNQGASPQQVVELNTGLEVPVYLVNRDQARKKAEEINQKIYMSLPPPIFYELGFYSMRFPAKAAAYALIAGLLIGKLIR